MLRSGLELNLYSFPPVAIIRAGGAESSESEPEIETGDNTTSEDGKSVSLELEVQTVPLSVSEAEIELEHQFESAHQTEAGLEQETKPTEEAQKTKDETAAESELNAEPDSEAGPEPKPEPKPEGESTSVNSSENHDHNQENPRASDPEEESVLDLEPQLNPENKGSNASHSDCQSQEVGLWEGFGPEDLPPWELGTAPVTKPVLVPKRKRPRTSETLSHSQKQEAVISFDFITKSARKVEIEPDFKKYPDVVFKIKCQSNNQAQERICSSDPSKETYHDLSPNSQTQTESAAAPSENERERSLADEFFDLLDDEVLILPSPDSITLTDSLHSHSSSFPPLHPPPPPPPPPSQCLEVVLYRPRPLMMGTASNTSATPAPPTTKISDLNPQSQQQHQAMSLPTPLGLPLSTSTDISEPILSDIFEKRYINKEIGWGLVAIRPIRAGTTLFADELLKMWTYEQQKCKTIQEANDLLEKKAKDLGPEWYAQFLELSKVERKGKDNAITAANERMLGVIGTVWDRHHIPAHWEGKAGGVLGLNLAWMNHSCIPNCSLRYLSVRDTNAKGQVNWDGQPKLERAVVRACTDIRAGVEISISYSQTRGSVKMRRCVTKMKFDFSCVCRVCATPHDSFETSLKEYHRFVDGLHDPRLIANKPAAVFHIAYQLVGILTSLRVQDIRLVNIWSRCAMVAGHHSDLARAFCFLTRAKQLCLVLEGLTGENYRQNDQWYKNPTLLPGFGATQRGLSTITEAIPIFKGGADSKTILFMLGTNPDEYTRVDRYRLITEDDEQDESKSKNGDKSKPGQKKELRWEITPGLDPVPPPLTFNTKEPHTMCCGKPGCQYEQEIETKRRKRRVCREKREAKQKESCQSDEQKCVGGQKDFLDLVLEIMEELEPSLDSDGAECPSTHRSEASSEVCCEAHHCPSPACLYSYMNEKQGEAGGLQKENMPLIQEVNSGQQNGKGQKKKKRKKKPKKKKNKQTDPAVVHVRAEKKVDLVELDNIGCCNAKVEK
ncbi:hypothetical protein BDV12DRAFT_198231 [Aspergillus spectabilis]